jgi:glucose-6-phosphate 1-epimerase
LSTASTIADLDRRFGIPGIAKVAIGDGGLPKVCITNSAAAGEMYLHGAHVTSWKPRGAEEVLFVSSKSAWKDGRAIRGGVPICFPWFADRSGDPTSPAHGFVRSKTWQLESIAQNGDAVTVSMVTESDEATKKWWPGDFRLFHRATFGSELTLELTVLNTGEVPLRFEEALHAYFRVGDIKQVRLQGLDSVHYLDKTDLGREKVQDGAIKIVSETDRVYLDTPQEIELDDQALRRRILVVKENSLTTVVWNPWVDKARALSDFGDDEWQEMVCIETSNVADFAVDLTPGQQHKMKAIIRLGGAVNPTAPH